MSRLLLVSNRLPVTVKTERESATVVPSAGGLATGLRGPHERSGGLWIGWPGDVSRLSELQRARVDEQLAARRCVPLHLSASEVSRFYEGYSNRVLWPLFHYFLERVPRQDRDFETYRKVNQRFADLVAEHYRPGDTLWVHDYQLMLVPGMLRAKLPGARIGFFLHIPFPSAEIFSTLPRRRELLEGLLGADLLGFHTLSYVRHFSGALLRLLGLDTEVDQVAFQGRRVRLGAFPMGIDAKSFESLAEEPAVLQEVSRHREGLRGQRLLLGIDRLDYTKGIPTRLLAVQRLLEREPAYRGKLRFVQVAVPSRTEVPAYAAYRDEVDELVGRINSTYGSVESVPIHYLYRSFNVRQLTALYRAADVALVTPVRDGMNLVAKEFCAARPDEDGVLVLSEFAGAAAEMGDALQVNPYDVDGMAEAFRRALALPAEERRARMQGLRAGVKSHDVHWWVSRFLEALRRTEEGGAGTGRLRVLDADALVEAMRSAPSLLLLLDYDGTLTPITSRPEQAAPDAQLLELLRKLAARPRTSVHVVSGRPKDTLESWLGGLELGLHGEHGLWSRPSRASAWTSLKDVPTAWRDRVRLILAAFSERVPGTFVEEKTASLAWHYRRADPEFAAYQARELRLHFVTLFSQEPLEAMQGDKVIEIRPRGVHKGRVVQPLLERLPEGTLAVAFGDDRTDEDLFDALPGSGLSVLVGSRPGNASLRLADPAAVRALLGRLSGPESAPLHP